MMQKPFTLTDDMAKELDDQISEVTHGQRDDTVGKSPSRIGLSGGKVSNGHSKGPAAIQWNDTGAFAEAVAVTGPPEDPINPAHYRRHPSGIECIEIARHMTFNIGNAIKYLWRYQDKGDPVENLKKAQWYIDDEIRRLEGKR